MPAADTAGNVTFFVAWGKPTTDTTSLKVFPVRTSNTAASLGSVADAAGIIAGLTLTATSYSLMYLNASTQLPVLEARAITVASSTIPNGAFCVLCPGA